MVVLALASAALIAGCGSSGSSGSSPAAGSSTTSKPAASPSSSASMSHGAAAGVPCKEIGKLRTSLTSLTKTKISPTSAGQLTKDIKNIQTELAALKGKAGGAFAGQAKSLTSSIDEVKKAAGQLNSSPMTAISQLTTSLAGLKAKAKPAIAEMNAACPK